MPPEQHQVFQSTDVGDLPIYLGPFNFFPTFFLVFSVWVLYFFGLSVASIQQYHYFCTLISYPATLLNSDISFNSFLMNSLGSSVYKDMPSANRDHFIYFFFPIDMPFIFFLLHCPGWNPRCDVNRSRKSRHPCPFRLLFPNPRGFHSCPFSGQSPLLVLLCWVLLSWRGVAQISLMLQNKQVSPRTKVNLD